MPASLSIVLVLGVIVVGMRVGLGLAPSVLGASWVLALVRGLSFEDWLGAILAAVTAEQTVLLLAMVVVILALSAVYTASGQSLRFLSAVRGVLRSRTVVLVLFPALIGLLPMPGGAVFSAPMVAQTAHDLKLTPEDQSLINYWFRHVWELAWPLYPGIILAASLANMPVTRVMAIMWPAPLLAIALGWGWILRPMVRQAPQQSAAAEVPQEAHLRDGLPLAVAIGGAIVGEWGCAHFFPGVAMEWGVVLAMLTALGVSLLLSRTNWRATVAEAAKENTVGLMAVVAAVFVFKEVLLRGQVVQGVALELGGGAALVVLAVVLPFVVGFVSGVTVAFVGATFPLLFGVAAASGADGHIPAVLCLGLCSGFAGLMASPLHTCYLMTCRYFRVDLVRLWPRVAVPSLLFIPAGGLGYWLLR